jgi:hypothetical protein
MSISKKKKKKKQQFFHLPKFFGQTRMSYCDLFHLLCYATSAATYGNRICKTCILHGLQIKPEFIVWDKSYLS